MKKLLLSTLLLGATLSSRSQVCATSISANPICTGQSATMTVISPTFNCVSSLPASLTTSLVGYYPFCGNANDMSGSSNNGIVTGASLSTDRFGNASSSYSFNGTSDYISLPSGSLTTLNITTQPFSVSFWIKTTDNSAILTGIGDCVNAGSGGFVAGISTGTNTGNGKISCTAQGNPWNWTTTTINNNLWHHIVCTYSTGTMKYYIDNVFDSQYTGYSTPLTWNGNRVIGTRDDLFMNASTNYAGIFDDLLIYKKALSVSEIAQIYNLGNVTYTWSSGGSSSVTVVSPTTTTNYTVTSSNGYNTCSSPITLTVNTCARINELNLASRISIYPNPSNGKFTLQIENEIINAELVLYNAIGQKVFEGKVLQGANEVDMGQLNKGFYYAIVTKDKRTMANYKIISE